MTRFWSVLAYLLAATVLCAAVSVQRKTAARSPRAGASQVQVLMRSLSLADKIAQLIIIRGYGDFPPSENVEYQHFVHYVRDLRVGGFIAAGRIRNGDVIPAQPFEMVAFVNHMQKTAKLPLLVGSDFERGASMRVAGTARFPYMMAFGAARDLNATRQLGRATATEARALGVNWVFAPDADVNNNPDNPIINTRSFGEDPAQVADHVGAFIEGAHSDLEHYILLSAKHFPGHGDTAQDSHMQLARLDQPKERLESVELVPFRAAIAHGIDSIMTAHLAVPAFESQEIPATVSRNVLTNLLRDELSYRGIVVTDALEMKGVASLYSAGEASVRAFEAGSDVLLMPPDPEATMRAMEAAVRSGRISLERLNRSVTRVLEAKIKVGLFRNRYVDLNGLTDELEAAKSEQLAQRVADQAFTLVKDDKHLFPVAAGSATCIAVMTDGAFSTRGQVLVNALKPALGSQMRVYLTNSTMPDSLLGSFAADMSSCPAIYVAAFITVAADRGTVELQGGLSGFLQKLIGGPAPVALIAFGNPYLLRTFPDASAYAATYSTASTSETSAANAMLGKIAISGKLPVSIPPLAKIGDGLSVPAQSQPASNAAR